MNRLPCGCVSLSGKVHAIDCLVPVVESRNREIAELKQQLAAMTKECDNTRRELVAHREKARGNYWAWQGDGHDYPESLVCPILISAEQFRAVQQQLAAQQDALKVVREHLVYVRPRLYELVRSYKQWIGTEHTQDFDEAKELLDKALTALDVIKP